mgnify:CR=1 FL=1
MDRLAAYIRRRNGHGRPPQKGCQQERVTGATAEG